MPELPDILLYTESLNRLIGATILRKVIIRSPFVLRTFEPAIESIESQRLIDVSNIGKRIRLQFESVTCVIFHLMIAGRFRWTDGNQPPTGKTALAAFQFESGTLVFTEASKKKRASIHVVRSVEETAAFDRGGLDARQITLEQFSNQLTIENRTLKRALTDPRFFFGIGNAYSDEILLRARLSPLKRTGQLSGDETRRLYHATVDTLNEWISRLKKQAGGGFPKKVTAFRPEMMAHGKYNEPCPQCGSSIQRIVYSENECNYCARCQTGGKLLADRSLSRLLKDEWPKTIEELEGP